MRLGFAARYCHLPLHPSHFFIFFLCCKPGLGGRAASRCQDWELQPTIWVAATSHGFCWSRRWPFMFHLPHSSNWLCKLRFDKFIARITIALSQKKYTTLIMHVWYTPLTSQVCDIVTQGACRAHFKLHLTQFLAVLAKSSMPSKLNKHVHKKIL